MPSMTGWITSALLLASCAAAAQESALVVGAVVPETGAHAAAAADYRKGLVLWAEEMNARPLGRAIDLRLKDDGSDAVRAGAGYAELIQDGAQILIGPYGSAATLTAAAEAERARRVLLNAAGPSGQVHKRPLRYVFQTVPPYSAYAEGVLAAAREAGAESLYIAARDDAPSREMAEAAQALAKKLGFGAVELEIYSAGTVDFLPQLYKAMSVHADAWIAFAEARDGADMVKTLKRQGYVPKLFYLRSSNDPRFIALVGQDAEFILGSKEYDARFPTEGNASFVQAFTAKWSVAPGPLAAQAYAAGSVLAEGLRRAGTADAAKLRATLGAMQVETVLGRYRVDPASGAQVGIKPVLTQIVKGRGRPVAAEVLPFVPWSEREILR
jgi:ABC-type branched-subunit amino acid transport system substrate-binding protein